MQQRLQSIAPGPSRDAGQHCEPASKRGADDGKPPVRSRTCRLYGPPEGRFNETVHDDGEEKCGGKEDRLRAPPQRRNPIVHKENVERPMHEIERIGHLTNAGGNGVRQNLARKTRGSGGDQQCRANTRHKRRKAWKGCRLGVGQDRPHHESQTENGQDLSDHAVLNPPMNGRPPQPNGKPRR